MNLIEKDITTMKNQQAAEGDTIVIAEVLAIEANTAGITTQIMTGDTGVKTNADMSILIIGGYTHQNIEEEITIMIMNQDQDHQHTLDITLIKKTVQAEEGAIEIHLDDLGIHLDDLGRRDQDTTRLMMERDTKNIVVHIANRTPLGRRNQLEIEVLTTRTTIPKDTETRMTIALQIKKAIL